MDLLDDDNGEDDDFYFPVPFTLINGNWSDRLNSDTFHFGLEAAACLGVLGRSDPRCADAFADLDSGAINRTAARIDEERAENEWRRKLSAKTQSSKKY